MRKLNLGQQMARRRKALAMSGAELGRRVGLSQSQISRLENGRQGFRSETLERVAKALGLEVADLLRGKGSAVSGKAVRRAGALCKSDIEEQLGRVALTKGLKTLPLEMARALTSEGVDTLTLRRLLRRVLRMSNEERAALWQRLSAKRPKKAKPHEP